MFNLSKQEKIVFLFIISVILVTFGWKLLSRERNTITIVPANVISESISIAQDKTADEEICIIHIAGAVHQPGVYQLSKGKRIIDALKMAGGEMEKANLNAVNLAAHLYDGQKIVIPFIPQNNEDMLIEAALSNEGSQQNTYSSSNSGLLNLNAVTSHQLETLPGIGPVLAERILEHRKNHGLFRHIEEIMSVPGIGEKKFEDIKELITVY